MWDIIGAIHKALRIESTWAFVGLIALVAAILGGAAAWVIDMGYKNSTDYKVDHPAPKQQAATSDNSARAGVAAQQLSPGGATTGNINQGPGSIAQVGGTGNSATVNNFGDPARRLTKEDRDILISQLAGSTSKVTFGSMLSAPDSYMYASDLQSAFRAAGVSSPEPEDRIAPMMFGEHPWAGVEICWWGTESKGSSVDVASDSPQGKIIGALQAAHVHSISVRVGPEIPEGLIRVVVGLNPEAKRD